MSRKKKYIQGKIRRTNHQYVQFGDVGLRADEVPVQSVDDREWPEGPVEKETKMAGFFPSAARLKRENEE